MIIVVDAINKHRFGPLLEDMFRLRARVFGERLGWDVTIENGMERDVFDDLDPTYGIGVDEDGQVVACVRALQTTGPHMLSDVFSGILGGEPPLRDPLVWESTRFCVDTSRLGRDVAKVSVSTITSELMIASIETAMRAGITDIVTVIDPIMNRIMKRSGNAPYDYLGETVPMGKVKAMAALLDCSKERVDAMRAYAGIDYDVFLSEEDALALTAPRTNAQDTVKDLKANMLALNGGIDMEDALECYCLEQISAAKTEDEVKKAYALVKSLLMSTT